MERRSLPLYNGGRGKIDKVGKCIDLLLASFLLFLFPGVFLHVRARERAYHIWLSEWKAYEGLIQRQGYITASMMEKFYGTGKGVFGELEIEILQWEEGKVESFVGWEEIKNTEVWYLEEQVYPFHTGDVLEVRIKMPFDFLERLYYIFCLPKDRERYFVDYIMIRDGILERGIE